MLDLAKLKTERNLGFGCSKINGSLGKKDSTYLLNSAYDSGIIYYDCARSYGYGYAEELVGSVFQNKREKIFITTKFGIDPPQKSSLLSAAKFIGRHIKKYIPVSKAMVQSMAGNQFVKPQLSIQYLDNCLHTSLKQLKTDYIDSYLIHEWVPEYTENSLLIDALNQYKEQGKIRSFGITANYNLLQTEIEKTQFDQYQFNFNLNQYDPHLLLSKNAVKAFYSIFSEVDFVQLQKNLKQHSKENTQAIAEIFGSDLSTISDISNAYFRLVWSELGSGIMNISMSKVSTIKKNCDLIDKPTLTSLQIEFIKNAFLGKIQ